MHPVLGHDRSSPSLQLSQLCRRPFNDSERVG